MTLLAFATRVGLSGDRGFNHDFLDSEPGIFSGKTSLPSKPERASEVKPAPDSQKNSRRVWPQKVLCGLLSEYMTTSKTVLLM